MSKVIYPKYNGYKAYDLAKEMDRALAGNAN
jgi:hypothetical protein